jgi:hypothetical protein
MKKSSFPEDNPEKSRFNDGFEFAKHIINPVTGLNLTETLELSKMNPLSPTQNIERLIKVQEARKDALLREAFRYDIQTDQGSIEWNKAYYESQISIFKKHLTEPIFEGYVITAYNGYIKFCETQINRLNNSDKDWKEIHEDFIKGKYIEDVSLNDFNEVMNYRKLPNGKQKIKWVGKKAEAVYFQKAAGFSMKQFNQCFITEDGKQFLVGNRSKLNPQGPFIAIMKKHNF